MPTPTALKTRMATAYWLTGSPSFGALLLKSSYTPSPLHDYVDDVVAHEWDDASYSRIAALSGLAVVTDPDDEVHLVATNPTWSSLAGGTPAYVCVFKTGGSDAAREIVSIQPTDGTVANGGDWTFQFSGESTPGTVVKVSEQSYS